MALSPSPQASKEKQVNEEPSSSEDEEESEEDEGSYSSEEEEKDKSNNAFSGEIGKDEDLKRFDSKINSMSVSNETGPDSDSDPGSPSGFKVQAVSSVPKSESKRSRGDESESHVPKSKISKSEEVGNSSYTPNPSGCITRLWSDKDEITVLNGLIEFNNNANIFAFHNFIKAKLQLDYSKDQLSSKIKRMKKRFLNTLKKSKNGNDPVFSNLHLENAFKLSKRIWGEYVGKEKVELDEKEIVMDEKYPFLSRSFDNLSSSIPSLEMSKSGMRFVFKRLSPSKAEELDKKWKVLTMEEIELQHKRLILMKEQLSFIRKCY